MARIQKGPPFISMLLSKASIASAAMTGYFQKGHFWFCILEQRCRHPIEFGPIKGLKALPGPRRTLRIQHQTSPQEKVLTAQVAGAGVHEPPCI